MIAPATEMTPPTSISPPKRGERIRKPTAKILESPPRRQPKVAQEGAEPGSAKRKSPKMESEGRYPKRQKRTKTTAAALKDKTNVPLPTPTKSVRFVSPAKGEGEDNQTEPAETSPKKTVGRPRRKAANRQPAAAPKSRKRTYAQFAEEFAAESAKLQANFVPRPKELQPIEPNCCKETTSRLNHGFIEVEPEPDSDDEDEDELPAPPPLPKRRSLKKGIEEKPTVPPHLQPAFAPIQNLEEHINAAHFVPGWVDLESKKLSPIETDVMHTVSQFYTSIIADKAEAQKATTSYLKNTPKEKLLWIGSKKASEPKPVKTEWSAAGVDALRSLRAQIEEQLAKLEIAEVLQGMANGNGAFV